MSDSLILASASPRRADVLRMLGLEFEVVIPEVDESIFDGEAPGPYVERLARTKASAVAERFPGRVVLAGDTVVVIDDEVLGKPTDSADAARMLGRLSGREHDVATGLSLVAPDGSIHSGVSTTGVSMRDFDEDTIRRYVATGEPLDKAGAYAIQSLGAALVRSVRGDYYSVVGLPVSLLVDLLDRGGFSHRFERHLST